MQKYRITVNVSNVEKEKNKKKYAEGEKKTNYGVSHTSDCSMHLYCEINDKKRVANI